MYIKNNNLKYENIIFLDIEYDKEKLTEISLVHYKRLNKKSYCLDSLLYKKVDIKNYSKWYLKNIFDENNLEQCETYSSKQIIDGINNFLENRKNNSLIVSHGLKGDVSILEKNNITIPKEIDKCCTLNYARFYETIDKYSLEYLSEYFNKTRGKHYALNDAEVTAYVFFTLMNKHGGLDENDIF